MSDFRKIVKRCNDLSLEAIRDAARQALPFQYRNKPWLLTSKGGSDADNTIYSQELQLDAYLASYIDWHKGKLLKAFALLQEPMPRLINVIDWACGQGIGTLFMLDYIRRKNLHCTIKEVILIEPSKIALQRAEFLIRLTDSHIKIRTLNKKIDEVTVDELNFTSSLSVFQIFSNKLSPKKTITTR